MIYQSVFDPWPIESESVQAVICSPPYYALRKYSIPDVIIGGGKDCKHEWGNKNITLKHKRGETNPGKEAFFKEAGASEDSGNQFCIHCQAWKGQYGLEPTPQMYVEHTWLWAKEAWRVLRNDGIFFLNLADSYAGSGGPGSQFDNKYKKYVYDFDKYKNPNRDVVNYPKKCQLLIPHRVAIALVEDGWVLRNTICWFKSNSMPESVTDRFSKKYEYIFMFTKQEKYYFDLDSIREPHKEVSIERVKGKWNGHREPMSAYANMDISRMCHPLVKNPGDVWIIPTQPSSEKHFAMWPERLVERLVKCSTKTGDIVLDCFAGSATTLKVAEQLHRKGIGIDLGYHEISKRRTSKIQKEMFV